jgi:hypothetical protein
MNKYTKKEIAVEYDCMESVKGPYTEGSPAIKKAIIEAQEPYTEEYTEVTTGKTGKTISCAVSRRDIINRAYDLLIQERM